MRLRAPRARPAMRLAQRRRGGRRRSRRGRRRSADAVRPRASRCCACWSRIRVSRARWPRVERREAWPGRRRTSGDRGPTPRRRPRRAMSAGRRRWRCRRSARARRSRCRRRGGRRGPGRPGPSSPSRRVRPRRTPARRPRQARDPGVGHVPRMARSGYSAVRTARPQLLRPQQDPRRTTMAHPATR